jgi:hypothetical protein
MGFMRQLQPGYCLREVLLDPRDAREGRSRENFTPNTFLHRIQESITNYAASWAEAEVEHYN